MLVRITRAEVSHKPQKSEDVQSIEKLKKRKENLVLVYSFFQGGGGYNVIKQLFRGWGDCEGKWLYITRGNALKKKFKKNLVVCLRSNLLQVISTSN